MQAWDIKKWRKVAEIVEDAREDMEQEPQTLTITRAGRRYLIQQKDGDLLVSHLYLTQTELEKLYSLIGVELLEADEGWNELAGD